MALQPLKIKITSDTGGLDRGLSKSQVMIAKFAKGAKLAMAAVAVAVAGAATGVGVLTRRSFELIDSQAKMAKSLKTSVASVQVLGRAAELSGVSLGELRTAAVALDRRLSQAVSGTGTAADALERLNLRAEDLAKLDVDQKIAVISDAMQKFIPEVERAAVGAQLFGDRAAFAISRVDAATIEQAANELRELGVLVSDMDAAQIERTNDAMSLLSRITEGMGNRIAVIVAPAFERLAYWMAEGAKEGGFLRGVIDALVVSFSGIVTATEFTVRAIANIWPITKEVFTRFLDIVSASSSAVQALGYEIAALFDSSSDSAAAAAFSWAEAELAFEDAMSPLQSIRDILDSMNATTEAAAKQVTKLGGSVTSAGDAAGGASEKFGEMFDKLSPLRDGFNAAGEGADAMAEKMRAASETVNRGFEDAAASAISNYKNAGQAAMKFASTAVNELLRVLVVQRAIAAFGGGSGGGGLFGTLIKGAFSLAGAAVGGGSAPAFGGASIIPTSGAPMLSFAGGGSTGNGPRSGGLDGMGGRLAMLHPQETIVDHTRGQSVGGTVVNQTFNLAPGVTPDAIAAIRADILPQARDVALASVADQRRRGGSKGRLL